MIVVTGHDYTLTTSIVDTLIHTLLMRLHISYYILLDLSKYFLSFALTASCTTLSYPKHR